MVSPNFNIIGNLMLYFGKNKMNQKKKKLIIAEVKKLIVFN